MYNSSNAVSANGAIMTSQHYQQLSAFNHRQVARVECLVGAQRVQQSAERLLLCTKMWPPPIASSASATTSTAAGGGGGGGGGGGSSTPVRAGESNERARRELANLRLLADEARRGGRTLLATTPDEDEAVADCAKRLQMSCVNCIEAVYRSVYASLSQHQQQASTDNQQQQQQQQLNRLAVARACDNILTSALGLELAINLAAGAGGSPDDKLLERLAEQLSQGLAELSKAGRPARLGGDPADVEALQLAVRCAATAVAQLQHGIRCVRATLAGSASQSGHSKDDSSPMDELRSRVHLAVENLRPSVATVLAVSGEARFSGRPLRLSEDAKAGKARALGHALPVALATVELLTAMAAALEQQGQQQQQQQRQRLGQLAEALNASCTECMAKISQSAINTTDAYGQN